MAFLPLASFGSSIPFKNILKQMSDMGSIQGELNSLKAERKMSELAVKGTQSQIAEMLKGDMGQDMKDVLSGKKKVELVHRKTSWKMKIKSFFEKLW